MKVRHLDSHFTYCGSLIDWSPFSQVELLTPSHRHQLLSEPPIPQLDPSACEERIISHEVKELGEHRYPSLSVSLPPPS